MRRSRSYVLGAFLLALVLFASACGTGEDGEEQAGGEQAGGGTVASQLTLGGPPECPKRPFCIPGLRDTYGVEFKEFVPLDVGGPATVQALEQGKIDVALLFTTSSVIEQKGWVQLEDDKDLQAAENITPVVRRDALDDTIRQRLDAVSAKLTTEKMTRLNGRVEIDKEDPADVAASFLRQEGLLQGPSGNGSVTVGAVSFAENQIVGEMYAQVLEDAGYDVERQLDLGSREILQPAMRSGEIDIAPEYLSTLLLFLDPKAQPSNEPQEATRLLEPLLARRGLVLLQPAEADDTNTFVVTKETAQTYNLSKVSDLAKETQQ